MYCTPEANIMLFVNYISIKKISGDTELKGGRARGGHEIEKVVLPHQVLCLPFVYRKLQLNNKFNQRSEKAQKQRKPVKWDKK